MKPTRKIVVRGRTLGGASPLVCSPLVAPTATQLLREARNVLARGPDVLEWRVDYFRDVADTEAVLEAARRLRAAIGDTPLIFTCRSAREGGQRTALRGQGVVGLYAAITAERLADFVDVEMANEPARVRRVIADAHRRRVRVILSSHDFKRTPPVKTLVARFLQAGRLGGDVAKVAVMPRNDRDVLTLLQALSEAKGKSRIPIIGMSMGPLGAVTRLIGGLFGSTLSFAVGEGTSAPGQPPIADLRAAFELLERSAIGRAVVRKRLEAT